jgi:class 3 adenylate cyclase
MVFPGRPWYVRADARSARRPHGRFVTVAGESREPTAESLDHAGEAAWIAGNYDEAFRLRERAYARYLDEGDEAKAALVAGLLSSEYYQRGDLAVGAGWQGTAERLLDGKPESSGHGFVMWIRSQIVLLFEKDLEAAFALAQETAEIGRRLADRDVEMLGLVTQARTLVRQGRVTEGMSLLDEAMAAAVSGRIGPYAACIVFCHTLSSCHELADYRRAAEWADAAQKCCVSERIVPSSGDCRIHKAGILRRSGAWGEAEAEVTRGCVEYSANAIHVGLGHYELGEIRLRRGDAEGAEEAFARAHELGRVPQPGLALLRLGQGRVDAAVALIEQAVAEETLELARTDLLSAQVEIALAAGDSTSAGSAAAELAAVATRFGTPALAASAASAEGRIRLAEGNAAAAVATLRGAQRLWHEAGVPYEAARARVLLADAQLDLGDSESAALELRAAHQTFERLGAVADDRRATAALRALAGAVDTDASDAATVVRTFMFTDIVDSTPLVEAIGDEAWVHVRRWHDETLRGLFAQHRGEEIDHAGDGFFVSFENAARALACAVEIQRTLSEHRRAHGFSPTLRVGLHACSAIRRGSGYGGKGVHTAARIGAHAGGGEILASAETFAQAATELPTSERRAVKLKGIAAPVEVAVVDWT